MIKNKNQFKKAINENIENIKIKRVYNFEKDNKIEVGSLARITYKQSNAIKIRYDTLNKELWCYYDWIDIQNNKMIYYSYVGNKFNNEMIEYLKNNNIELIPLTEMEKEKVNKNNNSEYQYKYIIMINEIIENM